VCHFASINWVIYLCHPNNVGGGCTCSTACFWGATSQTSYNIYETRSSRATPDTRIIYRSGPSNSGKPLVPPPMACNCLASARTQGGPKSFGRWGRVDLHFPIYPSRPSSDAPERIYLSQSPECTGRPCFLHMLESRSRGPRRLFLTNHLSSH
jgi:hypothetical protein